MNIHFEQAHRKPQVFSYLLGAFAVFTILMLTLSFIPFAELRLSFPSVSVQAAQTENKSVPAPVPAPPPPAGQAPALATRGPAGNVSSILAPQVIPVPVPSVP